MAFNVLARPALETRYGNKLNTIMVKFNKDFIPVESWTLPKVLLDRFEDMSNSGGATAAEKAAGGSHKVTVFKLTDR